MSRVQHLQVLGLLLIVFIWVSLKQGSGLILEVVYSGDKTEPVLALSALYSPL